MKNKYITEAEYFNFNKNLTLGVNYSEIFSRDPKWFTFLFSRYKFVSKLVDGLDNVCEFGSGEGLGSSLISQNVKKLTLYDNHENNIIESKRFLKNRKNIKIELQDFFELKSKTKYDAIYSLDVLEHIDKKQENDFYKSVCTNLKKDGFFIVGTPSIEFQKYANIKNKKFHINCKSAKDLKKLSLKFFKNVFIFGMNDEIVHSGAGVMNNYFFCLCTNKI